MKKFFDFVPEEYRRDRGVTVKEDGTVVLCSDLLDAMRTGKYSCCGKEWEWNREARPVAFTKGRMYSHTSLGGWHYAIIWFYDQTTQKWNGWECYPRHRGTPVFWSVLNDPDKPDFVSDEPKDSAEFYKDPVFQGVSLEKFLGLISSVFWADGEVKTPQEFAAIMATRPYESWAGCASFYAIPTPQNEWGWMYETISSRQLIWLPRDVVFTRGLRESQNFRGWVEKALGPATELAEPEWLEAALTLAIGVDRPCVSKYGQESSEAHNEGFFSAISRRPFEVYEEVVKPPVAPVRSYDFPAAMTGERRAAREEHLYQALQALRAV